MTAPIPSVTLPGGDKMPAYGQGTWHMGENRRHAAEEEASLRLGIEADAGGALLDVSGTPSDSIFTLGPPLRGQLYETTAIPEIRDQAAALAGRLLAACRARAIPLAASGIAGSARLSGIAAVRLAARAT